MINYIKNVFNDLKNNIDWSNIVIIGLVFNTMFVMYDMGLHSIISLNLAIIVLLSYNYFYNKILFYKNKSKNKSKINYLDSVKEFHKTFDHPINNINDNIDLKTRQLRVKLLFEELEELSEASDVQKTFSDLCENSNKLLKDKKDGSLINLKEELDALCDIQYILSGTVLSLGHHKNFDYGFKDVQESNMSKACENMKEVEDTIEMYVNERGMDNDNISYKEKDGKYIVYRKEDGKILKNKYYTPVELEKYVI